MEISDRQGTDSENRNQSSIEKLFTSRFCSMATLIDEMKPVVLVKYDLEYRKKLKMIFFPWKFRIIRILMQDRKTKVFCSLLFYMFCVFD